MSGEFCIMWFYDGEMQELVVRTERDAMEIAKALYTVSCACKVEFGEREYIETKNSFEEAVLEHSFS